MKTTFEFDEATSTWTRPKAEERPDTPRPRTKSTSAKNRNDEVLQKLIKDRIRRQQKDARVKKEIERRTIKSVVPPLSESELAACKQISDDDDDSDSDL